MSLIRRRLAASVARVRPGLGAVKTSLELLSRAGTPVPGLQAVVETVLQIIQYAEVSKRNRDQSMELAISAAQIVEALLHATVALRASELDDDFKRDLREFHRALEGICATMHDLARKDAWCRLLNREDHAVAIEEHRRALAHAITLFQIKDGVTRRRLMVRQHQELRDSIESLSAQLANAAPPSWPVAPVLSMPTSLEVDVPLELEDSVRLYLTFDIPAAL
ncbi:hypothetical protein PYCCODRAFT_1470293 [Trametes coccinea BRFM310]|uniref:Uncharacterized protein n=1 Tax=Trametes coccinea (strain BRFM310) TaxID=1353009 RepID=A0A1Y2IE21_TRAC3|nr:hypothetical protein PYCCODRAFT_1470293 [Trametes coccinea BRFM310]